MIVVPSSLPPSFEYLVLKTNHFPHKFFVITSCKYFRSIYLSALKIHDICVLEFFNPCAIAFLKPSPS